MLSVLVETDPKPAVHHVMSCAAASIITTAPLRHSADELFTKFKEQNYIELLNHQMKTPLAVRPVFLKSQQRVETLATLLQIGL